MTAGPEVLSECSMSIDLGNPRDGIAPGDWLATDAGSRYLVLTSRRVATRGHAQRNRWTMRVGRLPKNEPIPPGTAVWWVEWYERRRRR